MKYDSDQLDSYVHLTNYSVQKYSPEFSKFEIGNEVSFDTFQDYLDKFNFKMNVKAELYPKILKLVELSMKSVAHSINANKREGCFELFGYDFILDTSFNLFLIEINTNPGIDESSPLINVLIPRMINDMFKLTIDLIFPIPVKTEEEQQADDESKQELSGYRKVLIETMNLRNLNNPEMQSIPELKVMGQIKPGSIYFVPGYSDHENLWDKVCDLSMYASNTKNKTVKLTKTVSKSIRKIKSKSKAPS